MRDIVRWLDTQEEDDIIAALEEAPDSAVTLNAFNASLNREDRQRSSIYTTAETLLEAYSDPAR